MVKKKQQAASKYSQFKTQTYLQKNKQKQQNVVNSMLLLATQRYQWPSAFSPPSLYGEAAGAVQTVNLLTHRQVACFSEPLD